ncbi:MAG: hypothetical protein RJA70_3894 [Pseudomonadota bacterium]|jgi:hypothetical protein
MFKLHWDKGGEATLVETDANHVSFDSTTAWPPGAPIAGKTPEGQGYQVKVRGCRKLSAEPLLYRIEGRFISLSREQRTVLLSLEVARAARH